MNNKDLVVLKFGSESIFPSGSTVDERVDYFRKQLGNLINDTKGQERDYVIVSSGSVTLGKREYGSNSIDKIEAAAIGQPELINFWKSVISPHVGQILVDFMHNIDFSVSNGDFEEFKEIYERFIYNSQKEETFRTISRLLGLGYIPIINYNDAIDVGELEELSHFEDNDRTFSYICKILGELGNYKSITGVIYSSTPFMAGDDFPSINTGSSSLQTYTEYCKGTSICGTGGMESKLSEIWKLVENELITKGVIASIETKLEEILNEEKSESYNLISK